MLAGVFAHCNLTVSQACTLMICKVDQHMSTLDNLYFRDFQLNGQERKTMKDYKEIIWKKCIPAFFQRVKREDQYQSMHQIWKRCG